jgi:hypothetical protein
MTCRRSACAARWRARHSGHGTVGAGGVARAPLGSSGAEVPGVTNPGGNEGDQARTAAASRPVDCARIGGKGKSAASRIAACTRRIARSALHNNHSMACAVPCAIDQSYWVNSGSCADGGGASCGVEEDRPVAVHQQWASCGPCSSPHGCAAHQMQNFRVTAQQHVRSADQRRTQGRASSGATLDLPG